MWALRVSAKLVMGRSGWTFVEAEWRSLAHHLTLLPAFLRVFSGYRLPLERLATHAARPGSARDTAVADVC
jgi:hypothetical protein